MPSRSAEKGRQVSGDTTRIASHALRLPKLKGASLPPASAISARPSRTIHRACPRAWLADEQAVDRVKAGPVRPKRIEIRLAPELAMTLGMVNGGTRLPPSA